MRRRSTLFAWVVMSLFFATSGNAQTAQLVRGPYLQRGTPSSLIIRWRTDAPTASRVLYGDAPGHLTQMVDDPTLTLEHELTLNSLLPGMEYAYAVGTPDTLLAGNTAEYTFKTSPSLGSRVPIRAWIIGDSGTADANAAAVKNAYATYAGQQPTDLWLMLGDNAYATGTDAEYQAAVFDMYPEMLRKVALWPTRGNHDGVRAGPANDYYDLFTLPTQGQAGGVPSGTEAYYSFDFGNAHFICLDSEGSDRSPGGAMLTWLASDLAATEQEWVAAFWHHPPYSEGSHISDNPLDSGGRLRDMRENALPILEAGGVDVVFCGHSHSYERSFLLDGHYGVSSTLTPSMVLDAGDGHRTGDGAYEKGAGGPLPHQGAVYVVAGSSGQTRGGPLSHPVMFASLNVLGSVVLDIQGHRLEATFLNASGTVNDQFTMIKGAATDVDSPSPINGPQLSPAFPNPSSGKTNWSFSTPAAGQVRLRILDAAGRQVRVLVDAHMGAGDHEAQWDGRTDAGRPAGNGTYFGVLDFGGEVRTRKLVRRP